MSLKSLTLPTRTVKTPGGDLVVRGLSLDSVLGLVNRHGKMLGLMFQQYAGISDEQQRAVAAVQVAQGLLQEAPELGAEIIVLGAGDSLDDPENLKLARSLPAGVQIQALNDIAEMTFEAEGGLGNVVRLVLKAAQGTTSLLNDLQT